MSNFEQPVHAGDKPPTHSESGDKTATPPLSKSDNQTLLNSRPKDLPQDFATPIITDSAKLHPQGAFSPEGPPAKLFDDLGADGLKVKNGVYYSTQEKTDGSHRVISDPTAQTVLEDIAHPDGTNELIKSLKNYRQTETYDADGKLRSYGLIDNTANRPDQKQNVTSTREYDHGEKIEDNNRWQDSKGTWHENNFMKSSDGSIYTSVMDGNVTTKTRVNLDGSSNTSVQTRDVIDPRTGKPTMTVEYSSTPKKTDGQ
jgi:hypothetical protein